MKFTLPFLVASVAMIGAYSTLKAEPARPELLIKSLKAKAQALQGIAMEWDVEQIRYPDKALAEKLKDAVLSKSRNLSGSQISEEGATKNDYENAAKAAAKLGSEQREKRHVILEYVKAGMFKLTAEYPATDAHDAQQHVFIGDISKGLAFQIIPEMHMATVSDNPLDMQAWAIKGSPLLNLYRYLSVAKDVTIEPVSDSQVRVRFGANSDDEVELLINPKTTDISEAKTYNSGKLTAEISVNNNGGEVLYTQYNTADGSLQFRENWSLSKIAPIQKPETVSLRPELDEFFTCELEISGQPTRQISAADLLGGSFSVSNKK